MGIRTTIVTMGAALLVAAGSVSLRSQTPQRPAAPAGATPAVQVTYVGSKACQRCHAPIYERWSKTRMANVVRDPREHPEAIIPDFSKPDPLVTFTHDRRRARVRQQVEAALLHEGRRRLLPARRAVGRHAQAVASVPRASRTPTGGCRSIRPTTAKRPTGPLCDGCHSVNYDIQTKSRDRVERRLREVPRTRQRARPPTRSAPNIVNPAQARLRARQRHLHPVPLAGPAAEEPASRASTTTGRSASTRARS